MTFYSGSPILCILLTKKKGMQKKENEKMRYGIK